MVRRKYIRSLVDKLLVNYDICTPPIPVVALAKSLGADVHLQPAEDELSGFLYRNRQTRRTIIGVNSNHSETRRNFTAAHELGHFLLHDFSDVHVDKLYKVWHRDEVSSQGTSVEEKEANLFAAELLMPISFVYAELESDKFPDLLDDRTISTLADLFRVSVQAITFRLAYLGYDVH